MKQKAAKRRMKCKNIMIALAQCVSILKANNILRTVKIESARIIHMHRNTLIRYTYVHNNTQFIIFHICIANNTN